jgi:hypothetical protein
MRRGGTTAREACATGRGEQLVQLNQPMNAKIMFQDRNSCAMESYRDDPGA